MKTSDELLKGMDASTLFQLRCDMDNLIESLDKTITLTDQGSSVKGEFVMLAKFFNGQAQARLNYLRIQAADGTLRKETEDSQSQSANLDVQTP